MAVILAAGLPWGIRLPLFPEQWHITTLPVSRFGPFQAVFSVVPPTTIPAGNEEAAIPAGADETRQRRLFYNMNRFL